MIEKQGSARRSMKDESREWIARIRARLAELEMDRGQTAKRLTDKRLTEGDKQEQRETFAFLKEAIDGDRPADRKKFD